MRTEDENEGPGKFQLLYNGKIDRIRLAICLGATKADRMDFNVAVWELNQEWMVRIADSIRDHDNSFIKLRRRQRDDKPIQWVTSEQAAIRCDEVGIENRFFRLNPVVAQWLDTTDPVASDIDFIVM